MDFRNPLVPDNALFLECSYVNLVCHDLLMCTFSIGAWFFMLISIQTAYLERKDLQGKKIKQVQVYGRLGICLLTYDDPIAYRINPNPLAWSIRMFLMSANMPSLKLASMSQVTKARR